MKSFAFALLGSIVAADITRDAENAAEDIERFINDINDVPSEIERSLEDLTEELECWWADRNNGDGDCQKRRDHVARDECWNSSTGMEADGERPEWNHDNKVCVTAKTSCEMEGKSWYSIPTDWGFSSGCDYDGFAVPRHECENVDPRGRWDWNRNECSTEQAVCENDGGKWLEITQEWGVEAFCDHDGFELARRECWNSSGEVQMEWDWSNNVCATAKDKCESDGNTWACMQTSWGEDCFCDHDGKEVQRRECWNAGNDWSWDSDSCTVKQAMVMARIDAEVDLVALEAISTPVMEGKAAGQEIFEGLNGAVNAVVESWSPVIQEWAQKQQQTEEEAARQLQDLILDSVKVDGTSLRDIVGDKAPLNMKAKSVRSMVRQVIMQEEKPTKANVTVYIPDEEELMSLLAAFQAKSEAMAQRLEDIEREFAPKYEDLNREVERALESVGEDAENVVNHVGDFVKNITDSATVEFSLMKAAENNSDRAYMYAGASFGAISVIAAASILSTFNKKQTAENQEALL